MINKHKYKWFVWKLAAYHKQSQIGSSELLSVGIGGLIFPHRQKSMWIQSKYSNTPDAALSLIATPKKEQFLTAFITWLLATTV